jgi:hypothetical protein
MKMLRPLTSLAVLARLAAGAFAAVAAQAVPVPAQLKDGMLILRMPLRSGCAMVRMRPGNERGS